MELKAVSLHSIVICNCRPSLLLNSRRLGPYPKGNKNTDTAANFKCFRSMSDFAVLRSEALMSSSMQNPCSMKETKLTYYMSCAVVYEYHPNLPSHEFQHRDVSLSFSEAALMLIHGGKTQCIIYHLFLGGGWCPFHYQGANEYSVRTVAPYPAMAH